MPDSRSIVCYLARHGETTLNAFGSFRGNKNPPLNDKGRRDAHRLAKLFKPIDLCCVVCSDKARATETAGLIAKEKDLPVHETINLRALDVGDFSGRKRTPEAEAELQQYIDRPDVQIPGGESLNEFKSRIRPCLQEAIDLFKDTGVPPLLVAHSSVVHEVGSMLYNDHKSVVVDPGGVTAIYLQDGKLQAAPIFKPANVSPGVRADTVS